MKQELKPCHCGAEANLMYDDSTQVEMCYVECSKCLMATMQDTYENVINAWNTRPDHSGESAEMIQGETLTTETSESQMRYELLKIILAKFDAEDFISTTKREYIDGRGWQNITRPPIAETQSMEIVNELINQLKQQSDEK